MFLSNNKCSKYLYIIFVCYLIDIGTITTDYISLTEKLAFDKGVYLTGGAIPSYPTYYLRNIFYSLGELFFLLHFDIIM